MDRAQKRLLAYIELGGYPNFLPLYERLGYQVDRVTSGRKALAYLKKNRPDVIVGEFNYEPTFRDRVSNMDSILAAVQSRQTTKVIMFYEVEHDSHLLRLRERFSNFVALPYPVTELMLQQALEDAGDIGLH